MILPLIFSKLRIATIIADSAYRSSHVQTPIHDLAENAHTLFRQCLKLNRVSIERYVNIDYECLLHLARIERLHKQSNFNRRHASPLKSIVHRLLHAIQLCYFSSNDNAFIQKCYFELALVLLEYTKLPPETDKKISVKSLIVIDATDKHMAPLDSDRSSNSRQRQSGANLSVGTPNENLRKQHQLKQAAAVAIRAATQMALNQKHRYPIALLKIKLFLNDYLFLLI